MTTAILSFTTVGQVRLQCARPVIDEVRPLDAAPFAAWAREYAAAQHHRTGDMRLLELERERLRDVGSPGGAVPEEVRLLDLGRAIGVWLDGTQGWLARLLAATDEPPAAVPEALILEIETSSHPGEIEQAALDAPWELIATAQAGHLALDHRIRLSPVRRLDVPGDPRPPSRCRFSVLFMAAQPRDVTVLDFEREESAIAAEVGKLDPELLDLFVEESGMLDGLVAAAQRAAECTIAGETDPADPAHQAGPVDVIHVSCHGLGGSKPSLLLEDEVGDRVETTASHLDGALAAHVPALAFVSACSTAEASAVGRSLAAELCMRRWPAVLGWSGPVDDGDATWLAARLYRGLAQQVSLAEALAPCRLETVEPGRAPRRVWHQVRLFLGRAGGGRIESGTAARRPAGAEQRQYLDRLGRVPVARDDEFVGRRRALQRVLASLRSDSLVGSVIHGAGQLGKSSLAARVSDRRHDLRTVVIYKDYDAAAILSAIAAQVREGTDEIIARHRPDGPWDAPRFGLALRELLEGPCRAANSGAILLVIDDFEQVLAPPRAPETHANVRDGLDATISALIGAFAGAKTRSRLLFTSRYRFTAPDAGNLELTRQLWHEPLGAMPADDLAKRVRASMVGGVASDRAALTERAVRLAAAIELCQGNPGLLKILLTIIDRAPASWTSVHAELRGYAERGAPVTQIDLAEFMARVALGRLIDELEPRGRELLRLLIAFEAHIPAPVAGGLGPLAGIAEPARAAEAIERMITLGLLDLVLPSSSRPGTDAASHSGEREVAVNRLAAPPTIAATRQLLDDEMARVARTSLRPLRAAWESAVHSRALRECRELARLAQLAADASTLAEVAGPVVSAVAQTDARQATVLALAVEASEALWPDPDELRLMAEACQIAGHPEAAGRLLRRGLALENLASGARARLQLELASWHQLRGELDEALRILKEAGGSFERLGDVRAKAVTQGQIADILMARGELDQALRIRKQEELPVCELLGDVREKAVTQGKIADILMARGELDEALRIRQEEELPVYERLGDVRNTAVTQGQIADILMARGELDEALRIRQEEALPVYERLGDVRNTAVTQAKIADILMARGELDEALRILVEAGSLFERLRDVRSRAVTQGKIADILMARGEVDEALRIRREEALPVYERLGDVRNKAVTQAQIADILIERGELDEALRILMEAGGSFERLGDVRNKAVTQAQIADILMARGEVDEALLLLTEASGSFERLGDVREKAVTQGQIADILMEHGELEEALRIRQEEELPVYERLGDVRAMAVTQGQIADILMECGELDEALRIRTEEELPVYERLGDMLSKAVTQGKIADILEARGELDEALRITRDVVDSVERLGDMQSLCVALGNHAQMLLTEPTRARIVEAQAYLRRAFDITVRLGTPFPDELRELLAQLEQSPDV